MKCRSFIILALIHTWVPTQAQWSNYPTVNTAICTAANIQEFYNHDLLGRAEWRAIVSDDGGGAIIVWEDLRNGNNYDIYAQRINAKGVVQWTIDGIPICVAGHHQILPQIINDGAGGAIITWMDYRSETSYDVYAQRINSAGAIQWTINGKPIATAAYSQTSPILVSDGAGGAIITWGDTRNGDNGDIYSQRISASGVVQWATDGVQISTLPADQYPDRIISDDSGGAVITWADNRNGYWDIFAQRINAAGSAKWTADGVPICTAANYQYLPKLIGDGTGGAIITWGDDRNGNNSDIYAQRINAAGSVQWATDGVPICMASNNQQYYTIVGDGTGGAIITWEDYRNGNADIFIQRVDSSGAGAWAANGVPIASGTNTQISPTTISDDSGGCVIAWTEIPFGSQSDIYAQRVNALGNPQWTVGGFGISSAASYQSDPTIVHVGIGNAIIAWQDNRNNTSYPDIYAQIVYGSGTLDGPPTPPDNLVAVPANELVTLRWNRNMELDFLRYRLYGDTLPNPIIQIDSTTGGKDDTTKILLGLINNTAYYFRMTAVDSAGFESNYSNEVATTPASIVFPVNKRWNLISVPATLADNSKSAIFPTAVSPAYIYNGGYTIQDTLHHGVGYWLKFDGNEYISMSGDVLTEDTINVAEGWNLLGSITFPILASSITSDPSGIATSIFFGYSGSYFRADTILPGKGYWVKVTQSGRLILSLGGSASESARIRIVPSSDIPPSPPNERFTGHDVPKSFGLFQNFPNPFNPSTTIFFDVPISTFVTLKIYNVLGKEVTTLVDGLTQPGKFQVVWNATDVSTGIYFARLQTEKSVSTKKLVLLR